MEPAAPGVVAQWLFAGLAAIGFWFVVDMGLRLARKVRSISPAVSPGQKVKFTANTKVVGVTWKNPDGVSRQALIRKHARRGEDLQLVREPENPHDPNAVAVWLNRSRGQIGYIQEQLAADVAKAMDRGQAVRAVIKDLTGGGKGENCGVNISVSVYEPAAG